MKVSLFIKSCVCLFAALLLPGSANATDFMLPAARHSLDALTPVVAPRYAQSHSGKRGQQSSGFHLKRWQTSLTHVNQFSGGVAATEALLLDGERSVLSMDVVFGLQRCWNLAINIPLISHANGYFDRSIESWHQFFNLPNGNRADAEPNTLEIAYGTEGAPSLSLSNASTTLGDITLQASFECPGSRLFAGWTPSFGLKLPTGDESDLSGNGATDVLLGLTSNEFQWSDRLTGRAALSLAFAGDSPLFDREARHIIGGSLVAGYRWSSHHEWLAQLDVNSASFDSQLLELGETTAQLTVGWRHHYAPSRWFDIAIVEDVLADTAPDIALYLSWVNQTVP